LNIQKLGDLVRKIFFILILIVLSLNARTIEKIRFNGLLHISDQMAREIIGFNEGSKFNIEMIDESVKNFYKQNFFKDIIVEENNGVLTYNFKEKPVIAFVEISGMGNKADNLMEFIKLKKGDIYDKTKVKKAKEIILQYLEATGKFDSVVEEDIEWINEDSLKLTLVVNKGEEITIRKVNVIGANKYQFSDYQNKLKNKEREFMGWFIGRNNGKIDIFALNTDYRKIEDYYKRRGYLDVKVSPPLLKVDFAGYFADLTYQISEGESYIIESVEFKQSPNVIDITNLKEELWTQAGDRFNIIYLRKDLKTIENLVGDKGYAFVRIFPEIKRNNGKASIIINIIPNEKVTIRKVLISGNRRTLDRVIRREIYLSEGQIYSQTDMRDSRNALRRTGFFDKVTISKRRVSQTEMDLLVDVKEARTGNIVAGIGYGSFDGLMFNFKISDKNVFGSGIDVSANLDYSSRSTLGSLRYFNPRLNDTRFSYGGSIFSRTFNGYDYDQKTEGFSQTIGRKLTRNLNSSFTYKLTRTELSNLSDGLDKDLYRKGETIKSAIIPALSYNSTDDYFVPRNGIRARVSYEYAGVGGDEKYSKQNYTFSAYYGLEDIIDYDLIFRFKSRLRFAQDLGYLPINEKLYLGGVGSVRGYRSYSLSPRDKNSNRTGGRKSANLALEASFPLVPSAKMRLVLFYDRGWIGEDNFNEIQRAGTGVATEWFSPVGPIMFIFSRALMEEVGDSTSNFEFKIGRTF